MLTRGSGARWCRDSEEAQSGVTLVELLVVLILIGVVGSVVTTAVVTSLQSSFRVSSRALALNDLEVAGQRVSRDIRVADPLIITGDPLRELAVVIERDGRNLVRFQAQDGERELLQSVQPLSEEAIDGIGTPIGAGSTSLVTELDNVLSDPDQAVFSYYDAVGNRLECDLSTLDGTPIDPDACFDVLRRARLIGIRIVKEVPGGRPLVSETQVSIRSTRYQESLP